MFDEDWFTPFVFSPPSPLANESEPECTVTLPLQIPSEMNLCNSHHTPLLLIIPLVVEDTSFLQDPEYDWLQEPDLVLNMMDNMVVMNSNEDESDDEGEEIILEQGYLFPSCEQVTTKTFPIAPKKRKYTIIHRKKGLVRGFYKKYPRKTIFP